MAMSSFAPHHGHHGHHGHQGQATHHTTPSPHAFNLNRSKSVVAMPVATGVSVTKDGFVGPDGLDALPDKMESRHASSRGKVSLGVGPSTCSSAAFPDQDDDFLASNATQATSGRERALSILFTTRHIFPISHIRSTPAYRVSCRTSSRDLEGQFAPSDILSFRDLIIANPTTDGKSNPTTDGKSNFGTTATSA